MKKILLGFTLFAALSLICAGAALAAPVGPTEGLSVFADYENFYYDSASVGVGYGLGESLTVGGFYLLEWEDYGVYANLALGPIRLNGELVFEEFCTDGFFSALFALDLDPLTIGVGVGSYYCELDGLDDLGLVATAALKLDSLTVFGQVYYVDGYDLSYKIGASLTL